MKILVVNDDGFDAKGIRVLAKAMSQIGEVVVVSPATQQTAQGFAQTITKTIKVQKTDIDGIPAYKIWGTPRDCTNLGGAFFLKDVDVVVSGINEGCNLSNDISCSGTIGAASYGLEHHVPCVAVSLEVGKVMDYEYAGEVAKELVPWFMKQSFNKDFLLSINVPAIDSKQIKGYQVAGFGGLHSYGDEFKESFDGEFYYYDSVSLPVSTLEYKEDLEGDIYAISQGYIVISPLDIDLTSYPNMKVLNDSDLKDHMVK